MVHLLTRLDGQTELKQLGHQFKQNKDIKIVLSIKVDMIVPTSGCGVQIITKTRFNSLRAKINAIHQLKTFRVPICVLVGADCWPDYWKYIPSAVQVIVLGSLDDVYSFACKMCSAMTAEKFHTAKTYAHSVHDAMLQRCGERFYQHFINILPIPNLEAEVLLEACGGIQNLSQMHFDEIKEIAPLSLEEIDAVVNFLDNDSFEY